MLGDVLINRINELSNTSTNKSAHDSFWIKLRDIAVEEIITLYPQKIDSDIIVPVYYEILSENSVLIPDYYKQVLPSNNQERFRVLNRNLFTSNAFNPDGLANQKGIRAYKDINPNKKGYRIIYQGDVNNDIKE